LLAENKKKFALLFQHFHFIVDAEEIIIAFIVSNGGYCMLEEKFCTLHYTTSLNAMKIGYKENVGYFFPFKINWI
jgi:hypothetical protein